MSRDVHATYVNRVADALKQTGHPRRNEVLDDLRTHLEEMSARSGEAADIAELVESLGSPEEYAESLAPATGPRPAPWLGRRRAMRWALITGVVVLCGVVVAFALLPDRYTLWAHIKEARDANFVASPFFDLNAAKALTAGMKAHEIRDAIGYPWTRYPGMPEDMRQAGIERLAMHDHTATQDEIVWEYTKSYDSSAPFFTVCNVVTNRDLELLRVDTFTWDVPLDRREHFVKRPRSEHVNKAFLRAENSEELLLTPDDPNLYVVGHFRYDGKDIDKDLARVREWVTRSWKDVPMDRVRFLYIAGPADDDREAFEESLKALPPGTPVYRSWSGLGSMNTYGVMPGEPGEIVLYKAGTVYEYPPTKSWKRSELLKQATRDDQNWLVHRLLSEGD
ncbi:MAG: hypothetical protein GY851_18465 [bacterium]|nr:hypothetical protein [bacterium]